MLEAAISKAYSVGLDDSTGVAKERFAWLSISEVG